MIDNTLMGGGLLELEPPSMHNHHHHQLADPQFSLHPHMQTMGILGTSEIKDDNLIGLMEPTVVQKTSTVCSRGKGTASTTSDEDEPSFTEEGNERQFGGGKDKKGSPWHRMKWTSDMVRLLITVVSCVGEDGSLESSDGSRRKAAGGVLQKKGKWKTVSKIMIDRGCYVSPQQCEDKFNDLNKRYKRLNEILGHGITCRVVENPALLQSMAHLSAKNKSDVKKILSSKHLFYKEMCAYHNGQNLPTIPKLDLGSPMQLMVKSRDEQVSCGPRREGNNFEEAEEDENVDNEENEDGGLEEINNYDDVEGDVDVHDNVKRTKMNEEDNSFSSHPPTQDYERSISHVNVGTEITGLLQDGPSNSTLEEYELIKFHMLQLLDQRVGLQARAFELEQQWFRWQRFRRKKDQELEMLRLQNERRILENERMILQVKEKELELDLNSL